MSIPFGAAEAPLTQGVVAHEDVRQFITFALGDQQYCVDIMSVREIRATNVVTPLPSSPDYVKGVINLRGAIVPIIDLRARFQLGSPAGSSGQVVVIVSMNGRLAGLLVDSVSDILTVLKSDISPIPVAESELQLSYFEGLITSGDSMMIVIALERLAASTGREQHVRHAAIQPATAN